MTENRHTDELKRRAEKDLRDLFRIESVLGCGASSVVLLAEDVSNGMPVALKIVAMPPSAAGDLAMQFEAAASAVSSLKHSHLVPVFDFGSSDTFLWYSMQRQKGPSLEEVLTGSGRLDLNRSLGIIEQTANALDFLHRRGFTHGTVKPSQIFLVDGKWVRVADYTLSRILKGQGGEDSRLESRYAAPEDARALMGSAASDQYALAMTAHRCLFGPSEPTGDANERRGDFPDHVVDALTRASSDSPHQRFASVLDLATLLRGGSWVMSNPRERRGRAGRSDNPRAFVPGKHGKKAEEALNAQEPKPRARPNPFSAQKHEAPGQSILPTVHRGGVLTRLVHAGPMAQTISVGGAAVILALAGFAFLSQGSETSADEVPESETEIVQASQPVEQEATPAQKEAAPTQNPETQPPATDAQAGASTTEPPSVPQPETNDNGVSQTSDPEALPTSDTVATEEPVSAEPGLLFVNSVPWGRLYVDGTLIGNTPQLRLSISPGEHLIQILRDGYEPYVLELDVGVGDTVRLTDIELTPNGK